MRITKYAFSSEETDHVRRLFAQSHTLTIQDVGHAMRIRMRRAGELLRVVGVFVGYERRGTINVQVFTPRPDMDDVIAQRHAEQEIRRANQCNKPGVSRLPGPAHQWPGRSGASVHFDTDGMGRVVAYVGPERRSDPRWDLEDVA